MLFDFDGVVVLSEHLYDVATQEMAQQLGIVIPPSFNTRMRGQSDRVFFDALKVEFEVDIPADELYEMGRSILKRTFAQTVTHTPGYVEFHTRIRQLGWRSGLVTSTPRLLLDYIFEHSDLNDGFDHIITADDVEFPKPHPEPYLSMCQLMETEPSRTVVIEDSPAGVKAGRAAGCQVIAITTSSDPESLTEADFVVDSFEAVSELLPF